MSRSLLTIVSMVLAVVVCSCKRELLSSEQRQQQPISAAKPAPSPTPVTAPTICDYVQDETALTSAGWTKTFEDDFSTDLSNWNIWTGGAFNNELQYYQAANLQVSNGNLIIIVKKRNGYGCHYTVRCYTKNI